MPAWKILVIGAALVAASIITMGAASVAPQGSAGSAVAPASPESDIEPAPSRYGVSAAERTYGGESFRVEDW